MTIDDAIHNISAFLDMCAAMGFATEEELTMLDESEEVIRNFVREAREDV